MNKDKVIKILDGKKILKSSNNFQTYDEVDSIDGFKVLENRNKISEVTLRYLYKDKKASLLLQEFKKINKLIYTDNKTHDDGYGRAFEVFSLSVLLGITFEQALQYVINGGEDGKIDAVVWDDEKVSIYQIKMNSFLEEGVLELAKKNYKEFLKKRVITSSNSSHLQEFLAKNYHNIKDKQLKVCSITNSPTKRNNINSKEIFDKYFNKILLPQKENNIVLEIEIDETEDLETGNTYFNYAKTSSNIFLFAHAENFLNSLYSQGVNIKNSDKLFYDNVRGSVGINLPMQDTIKKSPKNFELYNNGLSILGDSKLTATSIIIKNPTIINGQQTLYNLMFAKENDIDLSDVIIPIFVKSLDDQKERLNVARFNNSQKQVKDIDLLSINAELREIQEKLLDDAVKINFESGYYLQLISNGKRISNSIVKKLFNRNEIISLTDFVRLYWLVENKKLLGSWKNNVGNMINLEIIQKNYHFTYNKAKKICEIIVLYYNFLDSLTKDERNKYQNSEVVFMFLLYSYDIDKVVSIIDYINGTIKNRVKPAKLIDLYKTNNITNYIKEAKTALNIK